MECFPDVWNVMMGNTMAYMDIHHVRPSHINPDTRHLGRWVLIQQENYKTQSASMASPNRRMLWDAFMVDYSRYIL